MLDLLSDDRNARYDPGNAAEGLVNNIVSLIHVWTEQLNVHTDFFSKMNIVGMRYMSYKLSYNCAQMMVQVGRNLNPVETNVLTQQFQQEMMTMMASESGGRRNKGRRR